MKKLPLFSVIAIFMGLLLCPLLPPAAYGQEPAALEEGIAQYNQENYEEAIEVLKKVRQEDPSSAEAAFYLGMAYRQTNDIQNAYDQFSEAVTLQPLSDNAILELIEVATLLDKLDVARQWIAVAEEHNVYPARVAYLKGTMLQKEGKYSEAVDAFARCKELDAAYGQTANFQIGVCYMNERKYKQAAELFSSAITQDPTTDMATYARRYEDAAEQWAFIERPLRVTIGVTGQYDTNYQTLPDPSDEAPAAFNASLAAIDKESLVMQNVVRLDYVPILKAPFVFNAGYAALNTLHQRYSTTNDTFANSFTLAPGLNFERYAVNLVANYTQNLKRDDSYERYTEVMSVGPLFRYLVATNQILEASVSATKKNFAREVAQPALEDQSSTGLDSYLSWVWLFREKAIFNLKFGYNRENADGANYTYDGYRTTANLIYPLFDAVRLQVSGDVYVQDYKNENVYYSNVARRDRNYTGSIGLTWTAMKYLDLIAQYMVTRVNSNIFAYDYDRQIVSLGMEIKF